MFSPLLIALCRFSCEDREVMRPPPAFSTILQRQGLYGSQSIGCCMRTHRK